MAQLLDGKEVARSMTQRIQDKVRALRERDVCPTLAIVRVGDDPSDRSYEKGALKRAERVGVRVRRHIYDEDISQAELLEEIEGLNQDETVHGVLIFRPLPSQIDDETVRTALLPEKDVDGITEGSLAGIFTGSHLGFAPCTARACMEILDHYHIDLTGKRTVVLGRSLVIGKPVAMMVMEKNATVTICHSRTDADEIMEICKQSDVLIAAMGRAAMVDGRYMKAGQIVLDVGINVTEEGKLCGDVKFEEAGETDFITPVPGGVGAVTTAVLMLQVVEAAAVQSQNA
ncbi:bifunctional 5,10-methylene-tetrahydrofolate dehydrogenase/5,10-methylene-tetrahydrofolate cyclohydrolase [Clostridiales bacterium]|nr:bifunctional 5,10-methylene-tetrahydrofolate dehydrogenase/5,10-methylene-tetrahydrofolate cyclohydrolase [Clostridiales bacterium]